MPKALITGVSGQDGSYLAELLIDKGYEVHGMVRRSSTMNTPRIDHIRGTATFHLHYGDLADPASLDRIVREVMPDEVYNLAAQSHVRVSFDMPAYTAQVTGMGALHLLESIRAAGLATKTRFYQASSSELYGDVIESPQNETTRFNPRSPYACAKAFAYYTTKNYRDAYGMFAVNGILFNHESPRRGENFVTRKITRAAARISYGKERVLKLGNTGARRDWGHAKDYVEAMWLMLQAQHPKDYVIATGVTRSVADFLEAAFQMAGLSWREFVKFDERLARPTDVELLCGDASRAKAELGWEPRTSFEALVREMVEHDLREVVKT